MIFNNGMGTAFLRQNRTHAYYNFTIRKSAVPRYYGAFFLLGFYNFKEPGNGLFDCDCGIAS